MYQIVDHGWTSGILRVDDETWIPTDPANTDYQAYLGWLAEGNEPEVIDLSG